MAVTEGVTPAPPPGDLPPMDLAARVDRLRERLEGAGCDALVVTDLTNVRYLTGFTGSAGIVLVAPDDLLLVSDGRYRDQAAGRTLEGPHRVDLIVRHRQKAIEAALCSTGEQKAPLTGLVLSHAQLTTNLTGSAPILLLDEIGAHFDALRRAALFDLIGHIGGQAFMTGTDRHLFDALGARAQAFNVSHGAIAPLQGS